MALVPRPTLQGGFLLIHSESRGFRLVAAIARDGRCDRGFFVSRLMRYQNEMAGRTFARAPSTLNSRVESVLKRWHADDLYVKKFEVNVETLLAYGPRNKKGQETGPAIVIHGREAYACIRITSLEERVAGRADAVMWIDGDRYKRWKPEILEAIIDHELQHLELRLNPKTDEPMCDDCGRPILKIREHDYQFGWFTVIAERHKSNAVEVIQAAQIAEQRQLYFPDFNMEPKRKKGA